MPHPLHIPLKDPSEGLWRQGSIRGLVHLIPRNKDYNQGLEATCDLVWEPGSLLQFPLCLIDGQ